MPTTWLVTLGDTEKNFRRKRDAVLWLVRLTHDERPRPTVHREHGFRYIYYGAGDLVFVVRAFIDKLGFPPRRFYAPKKLIAKKQVHESAAAPVADPEHVVARA